MFHLKTYHCNIAFLLNKQQEEPNLDIYQDFLSRYHLKAHECLFVDDLKENIDAAIKVGMKGFVYHQNIQELEKYIENIL